MVKHTHTIRRFLPTNCLSVFDHFVGLALKALTACTVKGYSRFFTFINPLIAKLMTSVFVLSYIVTHIYCCFSKSISVRKLISVIVLLSV